MKFIVSRRYDWIFFLSPPLASLVIGIAISHSAFTDSYHAIAFRQITLAALMSGTLTHAHLVAVFFRSHGNPAIRALHPLRFFVIPIVAWIAIVATPWAAVPASVLVIFWDVWHSGAQTFGFARIYDRNAGNPPAEGRRLDFWLNQLLYAGPILGGVTLIDHTGSLEDFRDLGATFFTAVPIFLEDRKRYLTWGVLTVGSLFLVYYLFVYFRLYKKGYRISFHKVFLLVSTGACSIYTWGFNSWGEAFFIMNLFHAVQYLALVWATEGEQITRRLRAGPALALAAYLASVLIYGAAAVLVDESLTVVWALTIVVSLMHFWYDGFVWSVARRQI